MCQSTRRWIMSGLLGMALVLATTALVADRMWQPRAAMQISPTAGGPVT